MSHNVNYHFSGWCQSHCPIWNRAALLHTKNSDVQIQVLNKRTCDVSGQNLHSSQIGRNTSQLRHQPQWKRGGLDGADQESYTGWLSSSSCLDREWTVRDKPPELPPRPELQLALVTCCCEMASARRASSWWNSGIHLKCFESGSCHRANNPKLLSRRKIPYVKQSPNLL